MNRKNVFVALVIGIITISCHTQNKGKDKVLFSPNRQIKIELQVQDFKEKSFSEIFFKVLYKSGDDYIEVLPKASLGIQRSDQRFDSLIFISESDPIVIHDNYEMVCGKRKKCENFAIEKTYRFANRNNQLVDIEFRAYNDGVAFRYVFANQSDSMVLITDEFTKYVLPDSTSRWMQPYQVAYEDFYLYSQTGVDTLNRQIWSYPALYKVSNNPVYVLISEANLKRNHCASMLSNGNNINEYKVTYPPARENFLQVGAKSFLPWKSPWRTLIIGGLSDIVESTLITDVSEPGKQNDFDWVKPGAVSWIYWANNHGSKDYQKVVEYVDMAMVMDWPYLLIDWEWDVMSNGGDVIDAVRYAHSKGVKPLLWYNSGTSWFGCGPIDRLLTMENREKEFKWLNEIGVYGIKVDFFAGDQQDMIQYYIDLMESAAKYKLMINFHGATLPRGWARTYPNLMTTEAVYGAEWYNNKHILTDKAAAHNATLPFTRNVVGSMDYTPVVFSNSQHPHITSYCHELALSILFESGLQHFADRPSAYLSLPSEVKNFLKSVPVNWDDIKFIDGAPGNKVILARKSAEHWYIGAINGKNEKQSLTFTLGFLEEGKYTLQLIKDGKNDKSFSYENLNIDCGDTVKVDCLSRGGFVGIISLKE